MNAEQRRRSTDQSDGGRRERGRGSGKSEEYRFAENLPDGGGTMAEREYEDYVVAERDSDSDEPDVLLDVPVVKVDQINLEVDELRARVALQAEVLDLLRLHVGADVFIGRVMLEIMGVEAQALLKVRLDNVARVLDRVLTTIDRNPQLLERITESVGSAVGDVGEGAGTAVEDVGEGTGTAAEELGEGAGSAVEDVGEGTGTAVEDVGAGAGSAVEDVGEGAGSAVEDVGAGAGSAVEDVGEGASETVEDTGETAKRTAQGAGRTAGKAARQTKGKEQKAKERGAAKRRDRTRESQGAKRSSGQSSGRKRDSDG
jgi:hypothetical protein